jgi:hypothetical protein
MNELFRVGPQLNKLGMRWVLRTASWCISLQVPSLAIESEHLPGCSVPKYLNQCYHTGTIYLLSGVINLHLFFIIFVERHC